MITFSNLICRLQNINFGKNIDKLYTYIRPDNLTPVKRVGKNTFVSLTRNPKYDYVYWSNQGFNHDNHIRLVLDGQKLAENYKIFSDDDFTGSRKHGNTKSRGTQFEEKVVGDINNVSKYILEVDILSENGKFNKRTTELVYYYCKTYNIPLYKLRIEHDKSSFEQYSLINIVDSTLVTGDKISINYKAKETLDKLKRTLDELDLSYNYIDENFPSNMNKTLLKKMYFYNNFDKNFIGYVVVRNCVPIALTNAIYDIHEFNKVIDTIKKIWYTDSYILANLIFINSKLYRIDNNTTKLNKLLYTNTDNLSNSERKSIEKEINKAITTKNEFLKGKYYYK